MGRRDWLRINRQIELRKLLKADSIFFVVSTPVYTLSSDGAMRAFHYKILLRQNAFESGQPRPRSAQQTRRLPRRRVLTLCYYGTDDLLPAQKCNEIFLRYLISVFSLSGFSFLRSYSYIPMSVQIAPTLNYSIYGHSSHYSGGRGYVKYVYHEIMRVQPTGRVRYMPEVR